MSQEGWPRRQFSVSMAEDVFQQLEVLRLRRRLGVAGRAVLVTEAVLLLLKLAPEMASQPFDPTRLPPAEPPAETPASVPAAPPDDTKEGR